MIPRPVGCAAARTPRRGPCRARAGSPHGPGGPGRASAGTTRAAQVWPTQRGWGAQAPGRAAGRRCPRRPRCGPPAGRRSRRFDRAAVRALGDVARERDQRFGKSATAAWVRYVRLMSAVDAAAAATPLQNASRNARRARSSHVVLQQAGKKPETRSSPEGSGRDHSRSGARARSPPRRTAEPGPRAQAYALAIDGPPGKVAIRLSSAGRSRRNARHAARHARATSAPSDRRSSHGSSPAMRARYRDRPRAAAGDAEHVGATADPLADREMAEKAKPAGASSARHAARCPGPARAAPASGHRRGGCCRLGGTRCARCR